MATIKAKVIQGGDKYFIQIELASEAVLIPLSEDKPKEVKGAFNKLIAQLKQGDLQIKLEEEREDLFWQVASEYLSQLNRELQEVRAELVKRKLNQP